MEDVPDLAGTRMVGQRTCGICASGIYLTDCLEGVPMPLATSIYKGERIGYIGRDDGDKLGAAGC